MLPSAFVCLSVRIILKHLVEGCGLGEERHSSVAPDPAPGISFSLSLTL